MTTETDPALTDLKERINSALNCASATSTVMTRHHLWVIRGVMADIDPERDLSAAELLALLAILAPVHSNILARRAGLAAADTLTPLSVVRG